MKVQVLLDCIDKNPIAVFPKSLALMAIASFFEKGRYRNKYYVELASVVNRLRGHGEKELGSSDQYILENVIIHNYFSSRNNSRCLQLDNLFTQITQTLKDNADNRTISDIRHINLLRISPRSPGA